MSSLIVLNKIKPLIKSDDPQKRAGAIEAIRMVDNFQADIIIANHLDHKKEPVAIVRKAAIVAASARENKQVTKALKSASTNDPDKKVKELAIKLLKRISS